MVGVDHSITSYVPFMSRSNKGNTGTTSSRMGGSSSSEDEYPDQWFADIESSWHRNFSWAAWSQFLGDDEILGPSHGLSRTDNGDLSASFSGSDESQDYLLDTTNNEDASESNSTDEKRL